MGSGVNSIFKLYQYSKMIDQMIKTQRS